LWVDSRSATGTNAGRLGAVTQQQRRIQRHNGCPRRWRVGNLIWFALLLWWKSFNAPLRFTPALEKSPDSSGEFLCFRSNVDLGGAEFALQLKLCFYDFFYIFHMPLLLGVYTNCCLCDCLVGAGVSAERRFTR